MRGENPDDEKPEVWKFNSDAELLAKMNELADDIESVVIPIQEAFDLVGPSGQRINQRGVGAIMKTCSGKVRCLDRESFQELLNAGFFQRHNLPVQLRVLPRLDGGPTGGK